MFLNQLFLFLNYFHLSNPYYHYLHLHLHNQISDPSRRLIIIAGNQEKNKFNKYTN